MNDVPQSADEHSAPTAELSRDRARGRLQAFISTLPPEVHARDDALERELAIANASAKAKLGKLYLFLAEVGRLAEPYVACRKGCSACCRIAVRESLSAGRYASHDLERVFATMLPLLVAGFRSLVNGDNRI
jgi:hypothetical protein